MITNKDVDTLARATAYGPDGDKLGRVGEVYLDNRTGEPGWITVVTGLFGTRRHFVPVDEATLDGAGVHVPFDKATVTSAPDIDENGELTPLEEDELYRYYNRSVVDDAPATAGRSDSGSDSDSGERGMLPPDVGSASGDRGVLPPDVAREDVAGNYRPPQNAQRDEPLEHSVPGGTATTPSAASGTSRDTADPTTGTESDIVGPGPTGPAHSPEPERTHDEERTAGGGDTPRTPRLVKRVVTTEYYEEHPGDADHPEKS